MTDFYDDLKLTRKQLKDECRRLKADHEGACRLAWQLYLAGTGQTNETFRGVRADPVEDVRQERERLLALAPGVE